MLRILLAIFITVHGLIHLMGFVKEFKIANVNQLTGKTIFPLSQGQLKIAGIFWLVACLLFVFVAAIVLKKFGTWWMPAAAGLLISQALIILYWQDAKFGTIANVIILLAAMINFGNWSFHRMVNSELKSFMPESNNERKVVTMESISSLPPVVQKWLQRSNMIGKEMIQTAHLHQKGEMRTKIDGSWLPVKAEQYFVIDNPAFFWKAKVKILPRVNFSARDKYLNGKGYMLIKLFGLFPLADNQGKEIDQSAMLRFLAEISWFPSAALCPYLKWEQLDSTSAQATMTWGDITAGGLFTFTRDGDVKNFETKRYFYRKEGSTLETWFINTDENGYKEFAGIRIPAKSTVTWKLAAGDFTWYKVEIMNLEFNNPVGL